MTDTARAVGERFVRSLATSRWLALRDLLDPTVDFKGMTPGRFWEAHTSDEVVSGVLRQWFEDTDHIEALVTHEVGDVADRHWLRYRLRVRNDEGMHLVEQHGYYDLQADGRMARLHLVCAGFRPIA